MNRHQRAWAALILGIIAGFAVLALLLDDSIAPRDRGTLTVLLFCGISLWFGLISRRRCDNQIDRR